MRKIILQFFKNFKMSVDEILFYIWIEVMNMNKFCHYTKTLSLLVWLKNNII